MAQQNTLNFDAQEAMARINSSKNASAKRLKSAFKNAEPKRQRKVMKVFEEQATKIVLADRAHGDPLFMGLDFDQFGTIEWDKLFDMLGPFLKLLLMLFA